MSRVEFGQLYVLTTVLFPLLGREDDHDRSAFNPHYLTHGNAVRLIPRFLWNPILAPAVSSFEVRAQFS